jgi:hypothetical protein
MRARTLAALTSALLAAGLARAQAQGTAPAPNAPASAAPGAPATAAPAGSAAAGVPPDPGKPGQPGVPADAPTVAARLDKNEGRVGDVFTLSVTSIGPRNVSTNLPTQLDLHPFEVMGGDPELEATDLGDGRVRRTFSLKVAAYEPGELTLPPIPVTYIGTGGHVLSRRTEPVTVKIASLLANEPDPKLKDPAAPVAVYREDLTLVYVAGGIVAAALGALIAIAVRRRLRNRAAFRPAPPPRPAHEVALERLDQLARNGLGNGTDPQSFYFQLSEIVRDYLGSRFEFLALEMTTEELMDQLARRAPRGLVMGEIAGWLSSCDLVKFAKLLPGDHETRGALETAIRIVESTRPRPEPQVGEGLPIRPETEKEVRP